MNELVLNSYMNISVGIFLLFNRLDTTGETRLVAVRSFGSSWLYILLKPTPGSKMNYACSHVKTHYALVELRLDLLSHI